MVVEKYGSYTFNQNDQYSKRKKVNVVLVPNQIIVVHWHPRNKKHLESKGYNYTHMGDSVEVKLEDMMEGSKCLVKVICDYCGKLHTKTYKDYFRYKASNGKDCCGDCHKKAIETNQAKYGGSSPACSPEVIAKISKTVQEKYGKDWPSQVDWVREKVENTNLTRYGYATPSQNPEIQLKQKQTCQRKYGGNSSQCSPEVRLKTLKTLTAYGKVCSSKQEQAMVATLKEIYGADKCYPQYLLDKVLFDCLLILDGIKIDIEYDGVYWHKDEHKDIRRDYFTISNGYKVLRFRGNYEVPTKEQIIEGVNYLVNSEHHHLIIDLDV